MKYWKRFVIEFIKMMTFPSLIFLTYQALDYYNITAEMAYLFFKITAIILVVFIAAMTAHAKANSTDTE